MMKEKKHIHLCGKLIGTLVKGKGARIYSGGKIYHTSRVLKLYEQREGEIHFETADAHYYLKSERVYAAVISISPTLSFAV